MNITINPFQQLYFSDDTQTEDNFVQLFSDEVLQTAIHPIFQGGNVVLSGTQGCGKTMILTLLRPETRIAYARSGKEFPVNRQMRNFVSAGINLTRSRITDLVQVTLGRGEEGDLKDLPTYFGDFFNFLVVADLIKSIETIGNHPEVFDDIVDLSRSNAFVEALTVQDCWFGALQGVGSLDELKQRIMQRIDFYRRWVNGNLAETEPPQWILHSKTNIGEPIARAAECLRLSKMIGPDVPVLIRIDQIEEMHRAFTPRQASLLLSFRKMVNRVFAARDARVHYRGGTRRYGWNKPEFMGVWGSEARLEHRRDYHLIDMDEELFARGEVPNSIFRKFAVDAFQKRIAYYFDLEEEMLPSNLAMSVFGKSPTAGERLAQLDLKFEPRQIDRALAIDVANDNGQWSDEWRAYLRALFRSGHEGMLDAVLAAAWGRQTGGAHYRVQHREQPPPTTAPWKLRRWWRKERLDQGVLQLTTRCQQRFMWWGFEDICSLSGGNITVFLHICHRVWDGFLKNESSLPSVRRTNLLVDGMIDKKIQATGILFASNEWFKKLPEEPMGNARQSFIEQLGSKLNLLMTGDMSMSYPGGNGISLKLSDFNSDDDRVIALKDFMRDAVGYGALFETEHSSKSKSGGRRVKFYLNPILCPRFQIPEARTKEPYYWSLEHLFQIVVKAQITLPKSRDNRPRLSEGHPVLPNFEDQDL